MARMISLDEFVAAAAMTGRRRKWIAKVFVAALAVSSACFVAFAFWLPTAADWTIYLSAPVYMLILFGGMLWLWRRDATPACPHCGKHNWQTPVWTIATRNCCYCGRKILDEPDFCEAWTEWDMTLAEFWTQAHAVWRRQRQAASYSMVLAGLLLLAFFALDRPAMAFLAPNMRRGNAIMVWCFLLFAIVTVNLGFMWWWVRRRERALGLQCPRCGHGLLLTWGAGVAACMTGNCGFCGRRILADSVETADEAPSWDPELPPILEWRTAGVRHFKKTLALVALLLSGMFVGLFLGLLSIIALTGSEVMVNPQWYHFAVFFGPVLIVPGIIGCCALKFGRRDPRLTCPHCKQNMTHDGGITVIASRRCPSCWRRVVAEPEAGIGQPS